MVKKKRKEKKKYKNKVKQCQYIFWGVIEGFINRKKDYRLINGLILLLCLVPRSDCVDILTQCGDRKRFHEGITPERLCEMLSPIDDPERCIPLRRYLSE